MTDILTPAGVPVPPAPRQPEPGTGPSSVPAPPGGLRPRPELSAAKQALREARLRGQHRAAPDVIAPRPRDGDLPLSFAQERFWFLDRLQPGTAGYNLPDVNRLLGPLDRPALERAVGEVLRRHESLRTIFRDVDGVPAQVVVPFEGFHLAVDDLSALDAAERQDEALRRAADFVARPFDLLAGPLFRARLLRLDDEEHLLLFCVHHIVTDGVSMNILFGEVSALYAAFREGRPSPLAPLPLQYADFAAWQREHWPTVAPARLAYWKSRLAGAPELLELPTDHPRPPVPSFRAASVPVRVDAEAAERLWAVAREEGATPFMATLAAFQVLLSRWSGSTDVVVGTPVAGRGRREVEGLIGLFFNTLPLRTDLSGDPTFRELLRRVRERSLADYAQQDVPFEQLVAELRPERSLSHATLFQVLFQLDAVEGGEGEMGGVRVRTGELREADGKFDLALLLQAGEDGIGGALSFGTDLFEPETARRMVEHLERIVAQAGADPDRRLSGIELMGDAERERLRAWNRTAAPYPAGRCVHELFQAQALRTPDAPAVFFAGGSATYREVDEAANRLANHLAGLGVGPESRVGLCLERGPEMVPCILGVMKAGGAWVPLDPAHPAERLAYLLDDSGVGVLLTQDRLRGRLPLRDGVRVIPVDAEWARIAGGSAEAPRTGVTSENLAYVIYTSGSTGRPKGVAMHHRGVSNYIDWGVRAYGADRGSGAPVFTSLAVDLTLTNLLPLFAGRAVHLLPEESPVEALAEVLRRTPGFGLVKITPVHLGLLNTMLAPEELAGAAETLVIGADFLPAEPTVPWQDHAPGVRLMNEYGPTETVVGCSAYPLPRGAHRQGSVPVGGPIQNLAFHVLDAGLRPVPVGLPGELCIGGAGVARGYLGRPGLTAEKFVPDPFAEPGARMYRTGDRARWLADGNLLVLGRTDNQVKVRGYRVELGEIEAALRRQAGVRDALVALREDRPGDRRLVAYVVADDADPAALRGQLRASLPEYMVPSAFVVLPQFPRTPTGKLDRRALPAPEYGADDGEREAPRNEVETELVALWEELLGVQGIGPTQNFFDLGGNSFLALRLFTRANRALGCDLPISTLFAGATVRHMADAVLEQRSAAPAAPASVVPLQPHGPLPPLFLVHSLDRDVMGYVGLVRHLGGKQPAYGVRDVGDDLARPIEQLAAEHVAAVRAVQPRGPYYLASWSFGGIVVFEMALQLQRAGETVAFVGQLDTRAPALIRDEPVLSDAEVLFRLAAESAESAGRSFALDWQALEGLPLDEQARRVGKALEAQEAAPSNFSLAGLMESFHAVRDRERSTAAYRPGRLDGVLTLFRAAEPPTHGGEFLASLSEADRHDLGWHAHVSAPPEVVVVPGSHITLASEPHVRVLAQRLRESLAAARARAEAAPFPRPEPAA